MLALRASRAGASPLLTNLPHLLQGERMNKERKGCSPEASQSADRSKPFPLHMGKKLEIVQNDRSLTVEELFEDSRRSAAEFSESNATPWKLPLP